MLLVCLAGHRWCRPQAGPTILIDTLVKMTASAGHAACSVPATGQRQRHVYFPRGCSSIQEFEALYGPDLFLEDPHLFNQVAVAEPAQRAVEELGVSLLFAANHTLFHNTDNHLSTSDPPTASIGSSRGRKHTSATAQQYYSSAACDVFQEHGNGVITCNPFAGMAWADIQRAAQEACQMLYTPPASPVMLSASSDIFEAPTPPPPPGDASDAAPSTATHTQPAAMRTASHPRVAAVDATHDPGSLLQLCHEQPHGQDPTDSQHQPSKRARIQLVGSGPGDAALLTLAAWDAIVHADVVVSDRLVPKAITGLARGTVFVARKTPGRAHLAQAELDNAVLTAARQGKYVVRLKCGDSFVFGRGGEEIRMYRQHGFEPEVIPGISCCIAAPAAAKVPLTLRGVAHQVLVTTAHGKDGSTPVLPPYIPHCTFVFLMGVGRLEMLRKGLVESSGFPHDLPVVIVQEASQATQRVVHTSLKTMVADARANGVKAPATIIMGAVAEKWAGAVPVASAHLHALTM